MDKKVGVYICSGCGIGDSIDVEQLAKVATSEKKVPVCKNHPSLCGAEGAELIRQDIAQEGVDTVVIAACSRRAKTDVFSYDSAKVVLERVNIREHVAWCQPPKEEDTQMMAEDYLRMGLAKAGKMEPPEPVRAVHGDGHRRQTSLQARMVAVAWQLVRRGRWDGAGSSL